MKTYLIATLAILVGLAYIPLTSAAEKSDPEAIIFLRVPNTPDGKPGIYYEPFMYHFGKSAHVKGSEIVKLSPPTPQGKITVLSKGFYGVEEPELSYDAKRIIFSGKKTADDRWEVWEMNVDGTGQRQITKGMGDVCSPCYMPDGRIVFSSTRHVAMKPERRRDEYDRDHARLAHRCNADGSNVEQISFNVSSDSEFIVMRDGRLMFQSWQHHGIRFMSSGASAFFTMNPDGTGFTDFWGNQRGSFRWKQREMPDGRIVFIDSTFHHCYGGGQVGMITPGDPNDPKTLKILTPDVKKSGPDSPGGRYRDPYPTQDGRLMVVWSPRAAWSAYRNPGGPNIEWGIYWFDYETKKAVRPIYNDPKYQSLNPIPLEPQPVPQIIPDHGIDRTKTSGTLLCLNAYLGQLDKEAYIKPGEIKKVRIIEGFGIHDEDPFFRSFPPGIGYSSFGSSSNSISNFEQKRVVGEAPVAEDGSFYVEVPADTVLHWQTLDKNGMALQDALTWAWVRPGERRVCVGCHEKRTTIPDLTSVPMATKFRPVSLNVPPEKRHTIDFRRDITPIVEKKCVSCHNAKKAEAGLDLSEGDKLVYQRVTDRLSGASRIRSAIFNKAYLNLNAAASAKLGKHVFPGLARKSPLIWRLNGHSVLYNAKVNQCPPDAPLTAEEKAKFALWVDLGAQWDNLPGNDELISYSREESAKLAAAHDKTIPKIYSNAQAAVETRCIECHSLKKTLGERKTLAEWKETVEEMRDKRKTWIKPEEVELLAGYLSKVTEDAGLIRDWRICGPFENNGALGVRTALGPEQSLDFGATYPGKNNKPATWKTIEVKNETAIINFESHYGKMDRATAYAYTTVTSDRDKVATLRISGDDMFEVFLNGEKILQRLMVQPFEYDKDAVPVQLVKGENHLMIKVHDNYSAWKLRARLTETDSPASLGMK